MDAEQPDADPDFTADFEVEADEAGSIGIRHLCEGHWWRFEVAEKNGRRQLVHAAHRANPDATRDSTSCAIDAYDTATLAARRRGWVD